jgi:hypothetical protein
MRRTTIMLAAASATILLFSGCASSSKGATATTTSKVAASTTAPGDTTPKSTTATTVPPPIVATGAHKNEPFCVTAVKFNNADSPFNNSAATSDDFKKFFSDVVTPGIAEMRGNEPAEVKAEVDTVTSAFEQLGKVFETNNWDLTKTASDANLSAILNGQAFGDATKKLDTYCGFGS